MTHRRPRIWDLVHAWWHESPRLVRWLVVAALVGGLVTIAASTGLLRWLGALLGAALLGRGAGPALRVLGARGRRRRAARRVIREERAAVKRRDAQEPAQDAALWRPAQGAAERAGEVSNDELDNLGHGL